MRMTSSSGIATTILRGTAYQAPCLVFLEHFKLGLCASHVNLAYRYNDVLEGRELVSYLVAGRTCLSRAEAQQVGRALQRCGVLMHVTQEHNFHDLGYFYRFNVERWRELRNW